MGRASNRTIPAGLTPDQQAEAQNRLNERTIRHQELVRAFAALIGDDEGTLFEGTSSYDLLWQDASRTCHIFEMKTIDSDADSQFIRAVGQLLYYEHFYVANEFPGAQTTKAIVVDRRVHDELCEFAEKLGTGVILVEDGAAEGLNDLGRRIVAQLPPS